MLEMLDTFKKLMKIKFQSKFPRLGREIKNTMVGIYVKIYFGHFWKKNPELYFAYPGFDAPLESMLAAISRAKACALSDSTFFPSWFLFFSLAAFFALSEEGSNEKQSTVLVTRLVRWL